MAETYAAALVGLVAFCFIGFGRGAVRIFATPVFAAAVAWVFALVAVPKMNVKELWLQGIIVFLAFALVCLLTLVVAPPEGAKNYSRRA